MQRIEYRIVAESVILSEGKFKDTMTSWGKKIGGMFKKKESPPPKTVGEKIKSVFTAMGQKAQKAKSAAQGAKKVANILDKFNRATKAVGNITGYSDLKKGYKNNPDFNKGLLKAGLTSGTVAAIGYGLHKRKKAKEKKQKEELLRDLKNQSKN